MFCGAVSAVSHRRMLLSWMLLEVGVLCATVPFLFWGVYAALCFDLKSPINQMRFKETFKSMMKHRSNMNSLMLFCVCSVELLHTFARMDPKQVRPVSRNQLQRCLVELVRPGWHRIAMCSSAFWKWNKVTDVEQSLLKALVTSRRPLMVSRRAKTRVFESVRLTLKGRNQQELFSEEILTIIDNPPNLPRVDWNWHLLWGFHEDLASQCSLRPSPVLPRLSACFNKPLKQSGKASSQSAS